MVRQGCLSSHLSPVQILFKIIGTKNQHPIASAPKGHIGNANNRLRMEIKLLYWCAIKLLLYPAVASMILITELLQRLSMPDVLMPESALQFLFSSLVLEVLAALLALESLYS